LQGRVSERGTADGHIRLNPWLRMVQCGADEVLLRHGSRSEISSVIYDEGKAGLLSRLLSSLSSPASVSQLRDAGVLRSDGEEAEANALVEQLLEQRVLVPEGMAPIDAFSALRFGRAEGSAVAIVGCGAVGQRLARALPGAGAPEILLLDDLPAGDPSANGAGFAVEAVANEIGELASVQTVTSSPRDSEALAEVFEGADLVIVALDEFSPSTLHAANGVALEADPPTPWLSVYLDGSTVIIGPAYVPPWTPCYAELETQIEAGIDHLPEYLVYRQAADGAAPTGGTPTVPAYAGVAAEWVAALALPMLRGEIAPLAGRSLMIDFERMTVDATSVLKLPRCPACRARRAYRHIFR
jgi:bacteriocin biosynthesis cyclodehydratase domain-containing protein